MARLAAKVTKLGMAFFMDLADSTHSSESDAAKGGRPLSARPAHITLWVGSNGRPTGQWEWDVGKHEDKSGTDGSGTYDPSKTKDVEDAGGGRHDKDDRT